MLFTYRLLIFVIVAILFFSSCHSSRHVAQSSQADSKIHRVTESKYESGRTKDRNGSKAVVYKSNTPLKRKALKRKYAVILKTSPRKIKNTRLYYFIDEWYGVQYKWGGNNQGGVDCSGLVCQLYKNVYGLNIKRTVATQHDDTRNFRRKRRLKEGDLIYFKTGGKEPSHVGIYLKNGYFLHSSVSNGVAINSLYETYWQRVYAGGGKVRKKKA